MCTIYIHFNHVLYFIIVLKIVLFYDYLFYFFKYTIYIYIKILILYNKRLKIIKLIIFLQIYSNQNISGHIRIRGNVYAYHDFNAHLINRFNPKRIVSLITNDTLTGKKLTNIYPGTSSISLFSYSHTHTFPVFSLSYFTSFKISSRENLYDGN